MSAGLKGNKAKNDPSCPKCNSQEIWRHGKNGAGNRQYLCRTCGRVFVRNPYLSADIKLIADRMIQEKIPVPTITSVLQGYVSRRWLYNRREILHV